MPLALQAPPFRWRRDQATVVRALARVLARERGLCLGVGADAEGDLPAQEAFAQADGQQHEVEREGHLARVRVRVRVRVSLTLTLTLTQP